MHAAGRERDYWTPKSYEGGAFNKRFLLALAEHFEREGPKVIERVARDQPAAYLKICALMVPKKLRLEQKTVGGAVDRRAARCGDQRLQEMLDERAGDDAKVIEGTAEGTALRAPTDRV